MHCFETYASMLRNKVKRMTMDSVVHITYIVKFYFDEIRVVAITKESS